MDDLDEARAALDEVRARRQRRQAKLDDARMAWAEAQRVIEEATGELERLDRIVADVPRRERILASPLDFPDVDLASIVAGLPDARAAAIDAEYQLALVEARRVAAIDERDEIGRRVRKAERKLDDSCDKIAAANGWSTRWSTLRT